MIFTPEQLYDPRWRLNNLYRVINDEGRDKQFILNNVQRNVIEDMWFRNVVLKSRKHGLSTLAGIMALDRALWEGGKQNCQMINDTMNHAEELFRRVIKYAYDHMPDEAKALMPIINETQRKMIFANDSIIQVDTSSVGGTPTFLHISEFGKIAQNTPVRAQDIWTGSVLSVSSTGKQMTFIESTAWGKSGLYRDIVDRARKIRDSGKQESELDFRLLFYPWYAKQDNRLFQGDQTINQEMADYFKRIEGGEGLSLIQKRQRYFVALQKAGGLDLQQKKWYANQYNQFGPDMMIHHPSTEDEPFTVAIEGAYFAHQFRRVYAEKRVGKFEVVPGLPVDTSWDIGMHDYMAIWFWQEVDGFVRAVDYYENSGQGLEHYVRVLEARGYRYGTHYAPHDINVKEVGTGKSRLESAEELGLRFKAVPRIGQKMDAIESARRMLDHVQFDERKCDEGIIHLEQYRKKWNPAANGWSDEPAKTGDDHCADAFMTLAQGKVFNWRVGAVLAANNESAWTAGKARW